MRREEELLREATSRRDRDDARRKAVEQALVWYGFVRWGHEVSRDFSAARATS